MVRNVLFITVAKSSTAFKSLRSSSLKSNTTISVNMSFPVDPFTKAYEGVPS